MAHNTIISIPQLGGETDTTYVARLLPKIINDIPRLNRYEETTYLYLACSRADWVKIHAHASMTSVSDNGSTASGVYSGITIFSDILDGIADGTFILQAKRQVYLRPNLFIASDATTSLPHVYDASNAEIAAFRFAADINDDTFGGVIAIDYNNTRARLAISWYDSTTSGTIEYNTKTGEKLPLSFPGIGIANVKYSPNGKIAAIVDYGSINLNISFYDMINYTFIKQIVVPGGVNPTNRALAWSHDGIFLAIGAYDVDSNPILQVFNYSTGLNVFTGTLPAGTSSINVVEFSPDNSKLAIAPQATGMTLAVYNTADWTRITALDSIQPGALVNDIRFSNDGTKLAVCGASGTWPDSFKLYAVSGWTVLNVINSGDKPDPSNSNQQFSISWNAASTRFAMVGAVAPTVHIFDTTSSPKWTLQSNPFPADPSYLIRYLDS